MINKIKQHFFLQQFIDTECCENDVEATISKNISTEDYVILDMDAYYKALKNKKIPPSVDCLILIRCSDGKYKLFLVELKDLETDKYLKKSNLIGKYNTTINDFLETYSSTFSFNGNLKDFKLLLVTNPYNWSDNCKMNERLKSTKLNFLNTMPPFRYNGFIKKIELELPNPIIQNC